MSVANTMERELAPAKVPLWREALVGADWLALRLSPVYYGFGVPRGDGSPVIIIPGFLGSDTYLMEMYHWLQRIGYRSYYSRIGRNSECPDILTERLFETIDRAQQETGRKVRLIGHSLGGLLARSAAIRRPEQVAQIISLAAPFRKIRAHPMILVAASLVRRRIHDRKDDTRPVKPDCFTASCPCDFATSLESQPPETISRAAIYTETDGVVDWRSCMEQEDELNTKVSGTHSGLAFNSQVYRRVAKLLAAAR